MVSPGDALEFYLKTTDLVQFIQSRYERMEALENKMVYSGLYGRDEAVLV